MPSARLRIALLLLLSAGLLGACVSRITVNTVRDKASRDLPCRDGDIDVKAVDDRPKTYTAEGCGHKVTYRCDGWDSYDQEPICHLEQ